MGRATVRNAGIMVLALALGACGSGGKSDAGSSAAASTETADVDACRYLTAAEAMAITTDKVQETIREDNGCRYRTNPDDGLRITVYPTGGRKQMEAVHNAARVLGGMAGEAEHKGAAGADAAAMMRPDESATPKLGDESAWGMARILTVRKGDAAVEVIPPLVHDPSTHSGYPMIKDEERRDIAVKVATQVLARLAP